MGVFFLVDADFLRAIVEDSPARAPWSSTLIALVPIVHLGGGALLAAGILSRLAALVQVPAVAGAVLFVYAPRGLFTPAQTLELTLLVLFLLCLLTVFGAKRLTLRSPGAP